ncbi:MAG TPA: ABC transporter ATP-binding protein [Myxococcaceae bacterium]|nr:ABC transporter ATP-binding protein [Myxococcaceae bacterium]
MIQVQGLTKYYGKHAAIRDLAFTIERGEVIGFLGLNGAGKTTTLKVLGCVLLPTAGRVTIDGFDVTREPHEIRKRIGFLPDTPPLYDEMTVGRYLAFVAQLRGVPAQDVRKRVEEVETQTSLREVDGEVISALSHGYRQRVGVAQAVVHNPALLILDEPTSGLDPVQIVEMRELIRRLKGSHTILVSSHILSEISQTCDRLLVIQDGELVAQGTEEQLGRSMGGLGTVEVEVRGTGESAAAALRQVAGVTAVRVLREENGVAALQLDAPGDLRPQIARAVVSANLDLLRIDRGGGKLESIFLKLTHGKVQA